MYSYFSSSVSGRNRAWAETCVYLNKKPEDVWPPLNIPEAGSSLRMPLHGWAPRFFYFSRSNYNLRGLWPRADMWLGSLWGCGNSVWTWFSTFLCGKKTPSPQILDNCLQSFSLPCNLLSPNSRHPLSPKGSEGYIVGLRQWVSPYADFRGLFSPDQTVLSSTVDIFIGLISMSIAHR